MTQKLYSNKFVSKSFRSIVDRFQFYEAQFVLDVMTIYSGFPYSFRVSGNGPAAPVLAGPFFFKIKITFHFYKK